MTIKIHCKYDELVAVDELLPHPKNRNSHPAEQITRLAKLIKYQGVRAPIVVSNLSKFMAKGHGTLLACIEAGMKKVPVVYQDFENEDQEYAFVQSDNAIASWAELDLAGINNDLQDLGPNLDDIDLLGIKDFSLDPSDKFIQEINKGDENSAWVDMPEFKEADKDIKLTIIFGTELERELFVNEKKIIITNRMSNQWTSRL